MKLSEAILKGIPLNNPGSHGFVTRPYDQYYATCSLTAAYVALGQAETHTLQEIFLAEPKTQYDWVVGFLSKYFNIPVGGVQPSSAFLCPVDYCRSQARLKGCFDIFDLTMHLNDTHMWTRKMVANFLAEKGL